MQVIRMSAHLRRRFFTSLSKILTRSTCYTLLFLEYETTDKVSGYKEVTKIKLVINVR